MACGALKKSAQVACPECGLEPKSDYEVARALILSRKFAAGETVVGRTSDELRAIAQGIRAGRPYRFDPEEQQRVIEQYRYLAGAASRRPALAFIKWIIPLALVLGLLIALLWPR